MRWLLLIGMVALAPSRVHAIVIMEPPIVRACPEPKPWADIERCLAQHGLKTRVARTMPDAKLLAVIESGDSGNEENQLALYVESGGKWHLGGFVETNGFDTEVLALEHQTANNHTGFRFDLGQISPTGVSFDGVTSRAGLRRARSSVYCAGDKPWCFQITTSCDVLLDGKVYATFRGTVSIVGNELRVTGDRSAAVACETPERTQLGWH